MKVQRQISWHCRLEEPCACTSWGRVEAESRINVLCVLCFAAISTSSKHTTNITSGDANSVQAKYELVGKASIDVRSVPSMSLAALHPGHATAVGFRSPCCGAARAPFTTSTTVSEPKRHALKAPWAERPLHHASCLVSTSHAAVPAQRPLQHRSTGEITMCWQVQWLIAARQNCMHLEQSMAFNGNHFIHCT